MRLSKAIKDQRGYALPLALALMVIGSVTLLPAINFASGSVKGIHRNDDGVRGLYAADAGIEQVIWSIRNGQVAPAGLGQTINGMDVTMDMVDKGLYILYMGQFVEAGGHNDSLSITGNISWDPVKKTYLYTITVVWQPISGTPVIHLDQIGAQLPPGFTYRAGSAHNFSTNLSRGEPDIVTDPLGVQMVNWVFATPRPSVSQNHPIATEKFYIDGPSDLKGDYSWISAEREDIGTVSEIQGELCLITATARADDGAITARVQADALIRDGGSPYIISWQVLQ